MKVQNAFVIVVLAIFGFLNGCDTIENIDDIRLPLTFTGQPKVENSYARDGKDYINLNTIKGYTDNKDKIDENGSEIQSMSVSLVDFQSNDVSINNCEFDRVDFFLKYDAIYNDTTSYPLGTYYNVKMSDYYKTPQTLTVDKAKVQEAIKYIKDRPMIEIVQKYGKVKNFPTNQQPFFNKILTKVSVTILLKAK